MEIVNNKSELLKRIRDNSQNIHSFGVKRMGIFGSFALDKADENSDVDFFIEFERDKKTFDNFIELSFYLQEITGRKIELITPQSLNKFIGKYILNEVE